jgi:Cyclo-malto-dextrinase C-terminal domain
VYFRHLDAETVMVAINKGANAAKLDLGRFRESLARGVAGRDVLSGARAELNDSLTVPAHDVVVIDVR